MEEKNFICAELLLAVLMLDLGYEKAPPEKAPLRHQLAWKLASEILGGNELKNLLKTALELKESGLERTLRPHDVSEGHRRIVQMTGRIKVLEARIVELEILTKIVRK